MDKTVNKLPLYQFTALAVVLLLLALQPNSGIDLRWHWMSSFVLVYLLVLTAGRLTKFSNAALATVLLVFGLVNLWALWFSGISDYILLGGLLPFSDAGGYFIDAQNILLGNNVSGASGKRPFYAAFLSTISAVFGNNLHRILAVQTMIVGFALVFLAITAKRLYGVVFTAFFMATIWLFYRRFIGETMTENLGLLFGCLALCFIWGACQKEKSKSLLFFGVFFLTFGLVSRAGPFFVLPVLAIWASVTFAEQPKRFNLSAFGVCILAILLVFVANKLLMQGLNVQIAPFANFSQTLYGLLAGGDWKMAREVNPALLSMGLEEESRETYRMAWEFFINDPMSLARGAVRAIMGLGFTMYLFGYSFHPTAPALIPTVALTLLAAVGLFRMLKDKVDPKNSMVFAVLVGCFLSAPFVPPWDADMMRVYASTIPFLSIVPAIGFVHITGARIVLGESHKVDTSKHKNGLYIGSVLGGLSLICCLALPISLKGHLANSLVVSSGVSAECRGGEAASEVVLFPSAQLYLTDKDQTFDLRQFGKQVLKQPAQVFESAGMLPTLHSFSHRQFLERAYRENISQETRQQIADATDFSMLSYAYFRESERNEISFGMLAFSRDWIAGEKKMACIQKLKNWPPFAVTN